MGDKETQGAPQDEDDTQPVSKDPSIVEKEPSIDEKQEDFIDSVREDTHKRSFFLVVGPIRV